MATRPRFLRGITKWFYLGTDKKEAFRNSLLRKALSSRGDKI